MSSAAKAGICVVIAVAVPVILSFLTGGAALFMFAPFYFMALLVAGAQMLASRHEKRSGRGQLPPRPAPGGQVVEGGHSGHPDDDRMPGQARRDASAPRLHGRDVILRTLRPLAVRRADCGTANLQVTKAWLQET